MDDGEKIVRAIELLMFSIAFSAGMLILGLLYLSVFN